MLEHLETARAKFNEFMESEMMTLMKAHADLKKEVELLRSAVNKSNHFYDKQTYAVKYKGEVPIVFHVHEDNRNQWYTVSRSPIGDISVDYPTKLAAVEAIDAAKLDPEHPLVKDHLS